MSFRELYEKEKHIIIHGQSVRFRIVKYIVIFILLGGIYVWKGLSVTGYVLLGMLIASVAVHFIFRWKTDAWTKSWGPYKKII